MPWLKKLIPLLLLLAAPTVAPAAGPGRAVTRLGDFTLSLARVNDRVWLFELSPGEVSADQPPDLSVMIDPAVRERLKIPRSADGQVWPGPESTVTVTRNPPLLTLSRPDGTQIFSLGPYTPDGRLAGLLFSGPFTHLLGLGADFRLQTNALNLMGQVSLPGGPFGNARLIGRNYRPNQVQIPIVYGLGAGLDCGALFVDETLPLQWNFKTR
ncbi:MAG: hypothetical protein LBV21_05045, partial [Candidatus Adiutrix sp.]|nr:hypothetical protein [Candidatus Adiutrix sp.]